jgi:cytochrome oxidase Cu insertion factor (SCO1/SenC/PrrC family)
VVEFRGRAAAAVRDIEYEENQERIMNETTTAPPPSGNSPPAASAADIARGRRTLIGLAALFFVPLAISFWLYYAGGWRPEGTINNGELITPPRPLEDAAFTLPDGTTSARAGLLRDKWTLVYIGSGVCDQACQRALWTMRQTRLLLAEDMQRVRRVFIATSDCCNTAFFEREHRGLDVVQPLDPAARELVAQFPAEQRNTTVFVVDPLGNLMLRFDTRANPKGLLKDLEKLLKLSHIG